MMMTKKINISEVIEQHVQTVYRPIAKRLLAGEINNVLLYGSRRSGKSYAIASMIILLMMTTDDSNAVVLANSFSDLMKTARPSFITQINNLGVAHLFEWTKEGSIFYRDGREIRFSTIYDDRAKSGKRGFDFNVGNFNILWLDEATTVPKRNAEGFDEIRAGMSGKRLVTFLSTNPATKSNWFYRRFFENENEFTKLKTTIYDNEFASKAMIKNLEALPEKKKAGELYGEWVNEGEQVFNYEVVDYSTLDEWPMHKRIVIAGMDLGFTNDPTTFVVIEYNHEIRTARILHVYKFGKMPTAEAIASHIKKYGWTKEIISDNSNLFMTEEISKYGIKINPIKMNLKNKQMGITTLQNIIFQIDDTDLDLIDEFDNYTFDSLDGNDHYLDAIRYALIDTIERFNLKFI